MTQPVTILDGHLPTGPPPIPESDLYHLTDTPNSGRGLFASTLIPAGTLILSTATNIPSTPPYPTPAISPLAWVIHRDYRKECCAYCFAYDRGREFKLRFPNRECGVVFCSLSCLQSWTQLNGSLGIKAWEKLEAGVRTIMTRQAKRSAHVSQAENQNIDSTQQERIAPTASQVNELWQTAIDTEDRMLWAKLMQKPTRDDHKRVHKGVRNSTVRDGDPNTMYYLLTAIITAYNAFQSVQTQSPNLDHLKLLNPSAPDLGMYPEGQMSLAVDMGMVSPREPNFLLGPLFHLTHSYAPYKAAVASSSHDEYEDSFYFLHSILPKELAMYLTPILVHNLNIRAAHNAFFIRPFNHTQHATDSHVQSSTANTSDGSDSGEMLGWAVYPSASFFNHSCQPNVRKVRINRTFEFYAVRDINAGEELCISYLGGEEETLKFAQRQNRLSEHWDFDCVCQKCFYGRRVWNLRHGESSWEQLSKKEKMELEKLGVTE